MSTAARLTLALTSIVICSCSAHPTPMQPAAVLTHGIAVGDVTSTRAIVWGRCSKPATLRVDLRSIATSAATSDQVKVGPETDFTGKVQFDGLRAGTRYEYRVTCTGTSGASESNVNALTGRFSTAPSAMAGQAVRLAWGGDLGGQNVCRDRERGYPIFDTVRAQSPDFFVGLGDLIYADSPCGPLGLYNNAQIPGPAVPATDIATFRDHWKYNRADAAFQRLLAETSCYPIWDDHEIRNDAGPKQDTWPSMPDLHLVPAALRAFLDYQPISPPPSQPTRLYQSIRWGKHLELFILDLRQYRDANLAADAAEHPKTMLGETQRRWFLERLQHSDATWKVIVSSVPLSIPTGAPNLGHDGWTGYGSGDGFENELLQILRVMQKTSPRNYVWITTDVHFGAAFRYTPFADDPDFTFVELISGPLTAGVFPQELYDRTFGTERLLKYGPPDDQPITDFDEAMRWFTFGVIDIDAGGTLSGRIVNGQGETVFALPP